MLGRVVLFEESPQNRTCLSLTLSCSLSRRLSAPEIDLIKGGKLRWSLIGSREIISGRREGRGGNFSRHRLPAGGEVKNRDRPGGLVSDVSGRYREVVLRRIDRLISRKRRLSAASRFNEIVLVVRVAFG